MKELVKLKLMLKLVLSSERKGKGKRLCIVFSSITFTMLIMLSDISFDTMQSQNGDHHYVDIDGCLLMIVQSCLTCVDVKNERRLSRSQSTCFTVHVVKIYLYADSLYAWKNMYIAP